MILRSMFDRVTVRVSDLEAGRRFYETLLGEDWGNFEIASASEPTRHLHVAFIAASRDEVDAFWRRGLEAGYESDGEPGLRPQYTADYYGAFLLDPDGNSVEAVHRPGRTEEGSPIDHLWLGVADLEASRDFYETVAPVLGVDVGEGNLPGYVFVGRNHRHIALIADGRAPAENVHLAFPVATNDAVAAFHG